MGLKFSAAISTQYKSEEMQNLLANTNDGMFLFTWKAILDDGSIVEQLDEASSMRILSDPEFVPPDHARISVKALPKDRVAEFRLIPTAATAKWNPALLERGPFVVLPKLEEGERFVSYWLTDYSINLRRHLRRTVIGIQKADGQKDLLVISPSGATKFCHDDNQSFEGE